jgi:hypothetical protein
MFLYEGQIFSEEDCKNLINSINEFRVAELYYNGNHGTKKSVIIPNQRNALKSELVLTKGSDFYYKINSLTEKVGYFLKSEEIKYQIVKYEKGHFIYKHRHDMDGGIFITVVIQLNDVDDYEGGDFVYWINDSQKSLNKKIGYGILIGPEVEHEVTIVTNGSRHSFVLFLEYHDIEPIIKQSLI